MAGRNDLEKEKKLATDSGIAILASTILLVGKAISKSKDRSQIQDQLSELNSKINDIKVQINDIDHKLGNLKNGWISSFFNSSEITDLENKRYQLRKDESELAAECEELRKELK